MNFKTPFKVLTTAALIGTLSLSAVAPGAASAAEKTSHSVKAKEVADHAVDYLVLKNSKGELTKLSFADYVALEVKGEAALIAGLGDFQIAYIATGNGNVYDLNDFAAAEISSPDAVATDILESLDEKDAELNPSVIADATDAKVEDGKVVVDTPAEEGDFEVTEVAAINATSAKVTFGAELKNDLTAADFTVADKETGDKLAVKSVKVADDKKSATIEFYDALEAKTTYTVDVKSGEETASSELTTDFTPATVEAEDQTVIGGTATAIEYTLKDATGAVVEADNLPEGYKVKFVSKAPITDGKITLTAGTSTKAKVTVVDKDDKTVAESSEFTISADAAVPTSVSQFTVASATPDFDADDFEANTDVVLDESNKVYTQFKDQLGNVISASALTEAGYTVTYSSKTPTVAVVAADGTVTTIAKGQATVAVTVKDEDDKTVLTKTFTINVKDAPKAGEISAAKEEVTVTNSGKSDSTQTVGVTVNDQYGKPFTLAEVPAVTLKDKDGETVTDGNDFVTVAADDSSETGKYVATVEGFVDGGEGDDKVLPAGEYTVELSSGDATKATFKVKVVEAGETAAGYKSTLSLGDTALTEDTIDLKDVSAEGTDITAAIATVDKDGYVVSDDVEPFKLELSTTNQAVETQAVDGKDKLTIKKAKFKAGDTIEVTIKVTPSEGAVPTTITKTLTVVDTTAKYDAAFSTTKVTGEAEDSFLSLLNSKLLVSKDGTKLTGNKETGQDTAITITNAEFVSTDEAVVAEDGTLAEGTTTVVVKSVELSNDAVVTFDTAKVFTVTVKPAAE